eukprot:Unigene4479_Nuclearia_a/m.13691 Unigene4479_Nuclearia_a/g.13691  ORF Unigene4479_Nuclearia_a/g.13691 Unigene4479_Nuclearia_a/m.13691 type:complete len:254 (+) Unigene4479_Nuclearia_a:2545-3306(+)
MQRVINLGRVSRERRNLPIKTPLKEAIVIHHDPQVLSDLRALESYIVLELNVRLFTCSSAQSGFSEVLRADPNLPVLGKRLGKDLKEVTARVRALTTAEVRKLQDDDGSLQIGAHKLTADDVLIRKEYDLGGSTTLECNSDGDLTVVLDCVNESALVLEGLARELINRIQKLRKKALLKAADNIVTFYELQDDVNDQLAETLVTQREFLLSNLKALPLPASEIATRFPTAQAIIAEDQEIRKSTLRLILYWGE